MGDGANLPVVREIDVGEQRSPQWLQGPGRSAGTPISTRSSEIGVMIVSGSEH